MIHRFVLILLIASSCLVHVFAQAIHPIPKYVPPEMDAYGEGGYYDEMAVLETSCSTMEDVKSLWHQLTEAGALVAVISSPQRWLAWVPEEHREAIMNTRVQSARGQIGIVSVSYTAAEFQARKGISIMTSPNEETADADEGLIHFLDYVKRQLTDDDRQRIEDRQLELEYLRSTQPPLDCLKGLEVIPVPQQKGTGVQGEGDQVTRKTAVLGLIVHNSFFLESSSGPWSWPANVYDRYRTLCIAGMAYWTALAAKYGRSATNYWRLFGPTHTATQLGFEAASMNNEHTFIPIVIERLAPPSFWDWFFGRIPSWNGPGLNRGDAWAYYYNNKMRDAFSADESLCGFIAYKPSGDAGIWPHARGIIWGNGDLEGTYYAMDTQYSGSDPLSAPDRNVIAHEIGHLYGGPDEYNADGCNWSYRGAPNINCQVTRSASSFGRPGWNIMGFDGIMAWNYTRGTSTATPVHVGLLSSSSMSPIRCFSTSPANIPITINTSDNGNRIFNSSICLPMEYDFVHRTTVPLTRNISGTTWYFDYWEVKRQSGATTNIDWYINDLPSYAFTSTKANPVVDIKAVYTNAPPDVFTVNNTLTAWLSVTSHGTTPTRAIALRWRNKYDMTQTQTKVEYERTSGNWIELTGAHVTIGGPLNVGINQYAGVHITSTPEVSGNQAIQPNKSYRFRIVGYFNTIRGNASTPASLLTRPSSPADSAFCYDTNEPNSLASPKVLSSSGPGMLAYSLRGGVTITGQTGEFSWYNIKNDYYRLTVIGISSALFGENLTLTLRVRDMSNFKPKFRAQRAGSATHINASYAGSGVYRLRLTEDGEYVIKVEPEMTGWHLVDPTGGHFGFGEYTIEVERSQNQPSIALPCPGCWRLNVQNPFPGILVSNAKFALFDQGLPGMPPFEFDLKVYPPPGFMFDSFFDVFFDFEIADPKANPTKLRSKQVPNPQGQDELMITLTPLPNDRAELVLVHPDGPFGVAERRTTHPIGSATNAVANPPATHIFAGWGGDSVATTNPLPVTMWRHKKLYARWKEKPCVTEPMTKWLHRINFQNARQGNVLLEYGMEPGAGDGLEPGQTDLPPVPPPGTFDIRWINIPGSQGSTTDLRAVVESHIYQGRVQTGTGTTPVQMTWGVPPATPEATFMLTIQGEPAPIDMRLTSSHTFSVEGTYIIRIEVKAKQCPPPTKEPEVKVEVVRVDGKNYPCVELGLLIRDRKTNEILPYYDPYKLKLFEEQENGENQGMTQTEILSMDLRATNPMYSHLFRLCSDRKDDKPDRKIVIVVDNEDPDTKDEEIEVPIPIPVPTGTGNPVRFVQQHSRDWELISKPLDTKETDPTVFFTDPLTRLYEFNTSNGAYEVPESMLFGTGYWLKTTEPSTTYYGYEKTLFEWNTLNGVGEPYGYGWNLIGALSRTINVSAIQATPPSGLRAIFGYNPSTGYQIPTQVEVGRGYWVRVDPGTKLKMQASSVRGNDGTAYEKIAAGLTITGTLSFATEHNEQQQLMLTSSVLSPSEVDILQLPQQPPGNGLDVRSDAGIRFLPVGTSSFVVRASGKTTIAFEPSSQDAVHYTLLTEQGEVLAEFGSTESFSMTLPLQGSTRFLLKSESRRMSGLPLAFGGMYPRPFNAGNGVPATISFTMPERANVNVTVHDVLGRTVRTLLTGEVAAGQQFLRWDGRDNEGNLVAPGTYVLRFGAMRQLFNESITIVK